MGMGWGSKHEPAELARWVHSAYGVVSAVGALLALRFFPPEGSWWATMALAAVAWLAISQGVNIYSEYLLSLELGVLFFAFLVYGPKTALITLLFTVALQVGSAANRRPLREQADKLLRKAGNFTILGVSLLAACWAYDMAHGPRHLEVLGAGAIGPILLFWAVFAIVNNAFFLPVDWLRSERGKFAGAFFKEAGLDALLHLLAVLTGVGFILAYEHSGIIAVLLLLPVIVVTLFALRRASLQRKTLGRQLESLELLNGASERLHGSLDLRDVLDEVERICQQLFQADTYFLAMQDERTGLVEYAKAVDQGKVLDLQLRDLGQGLTGHVMRTGQPLFIEDFQKEEPWKSLGKSEGDTAKLAHSVMMAPLNHRGRVIGVLSVQSTQARVYKSFQKELFLQVCQQVVSAIAAARLYRRATQDFLTRLFNKSYFEEHLSRLLSEAKPFGLVFLDCDNFKEINDRFGHVVGDQYLESLGKRLTELCRSSDIPCRYGGDEFAILLPGTSAEHTRLVAKRIQDAVRRIPSPVPGKELRTTVSIGTLWSGGNRTGLPVEDIVRKVDAALYKAKVRRDSIEETSL